MLRGEKEWEVKLRDVSKRLEEISRRLDILEDRIRGLSKKDTMIGKPVGDSSIDSI